MSYSTLEPRTREIAEAVLTQKQLDVLKLWLAGAGIARIAIMLDISPSTARAHKERALQKLNIHLRKDKDATAA